VHMVGLHYKILLSNCSIKLKIISVKFKLPVRKNPFTIVKDVDVTTTEYIRAILLC
jgi:hypothetical protein